MGLLQWSIKFDLVVLSETRRKNGHLGRVIANSCCVEVVSSGCVYSLTEGVYEEAK